MITLRLAALAVGLVLVLVGGSAGGVGGVMIAAVGISLVAPIRRVYGILR